MCNKHFSSANGYSVQVIKFLAKGVPFERISWGITSDSTASRLVRLETFAALQAVGLNELLIGCERLLRFRQAPNPAVSLKHPAQEGQRLVRVTLQEKGVAEMIAGDRISGANLQLGAEFRGRYGWRDNDGRLHIEKLVTATDDLPLRARVAVVSARVALARGSGDDAVRRLTEVSMAMERLVPIRLEADRAGFHLIARRATLRAR